jgi:hypothetical protein
LLEDGTGVPLDGVGVVALEGGGLNIMVGGGNARWKRTEDGRGVLVGQIQNCVQRQS